LLPAPGPPDRVPPGEEVVAPVPVLDLDHVTGRPEPVDLLLENDLHRGLPSAVGGGVRQQRHLPRVLDRAGDLPLLLAGDPGHPPCPDLAAIGDELPQQRGVLVVDVGDALLVEGVHLLLRLSRCGSLGHCSQSPVAQNGGSSSKLPPAAAPVGAAGVADAHGSSVADPEPKPPPDERDIFCTLAVAYRSDGPISSTSTSKTVRFSPSLVSYERCLSRPERITRVSRCSDSATFSAACRHTLQVRNSASPSFHSPVWRSRYLGVDATRNFATAAPDGVNRSSGSSVRLPISVMVVSPAMLSSPSSCARPRRDAAPSVPSCASLPHRCDPRACPQCGWGRTTLVRSTASFSRSCRSSSATACGGACTSMTT